MILKADGGLSFTRLSLRPTRRPANGLIMIIGYGIIAVPTGIVTVELAQAFGRKISTQACLECSAEGHDNDAKFCKYCGSRL